MIGTKDTHVREHILYPNMCLVTNSSLDDHEWKAALVQLASVKTINKKYTFGSVCGRVCQQFKHNNLPVVGCCGNVLFIAALLLCDTVNYDSQLAVDSIHCMLKYIIS